MRVFIATDIDEAVRKGIGALQRELMGKVRLGKGDVKWVSPDAMHLTLKFMGEVGDEQAVEICNIVKNVAAEHKSFQLSIETVGYFGGKSARVLWVGTGAGSDDLRRLIRLYYYGAVRAFVLADSAFGGFVSASGFVDDAYDGFNLPLRLRNDRCRT